LFGAKNASVNLKSVIWINGVCVTIAARRSKIGMTIERLILAEKIAMNRLDYKIDEDGIERRISHETVIKILSCLYPHVYQAIEKKIRLQKIAFVYFCRGKKATIKYVGPNSKDGFKS
jgi:hypothetical protein